jgi:L-fuconolactonase
MKRIDAHQHYWTLGLGHNNWPTPDLSAIYRDFTPADLAPHLNACGVVRTVLVQAAPNVAETVFLLDLSENEDLIAAVVGWVDICAPSAAEDLRRLNRYSKFKGIRPMLQGIADTAYILQPVALATLGLVAEMGLRFDALIQPRHLPVIAALADYLPALPIVVDHGAKPFIEKGITEPWRADMAALAQRSNVSVKLSGLVTEAGESWSVECLKPYASHLLEVFGPERVMFGSDWPVVELASTYERWMEVAIALTAHLDAAGRQAVFHGTAAAFYGIAD